MIDFAVDLASLNGANALAWQHFGRSRVGRLVASALDGFDELNVAKQTVIDRYGGPRGSG